MADFIESSAKVKMVKSPSLLWVEGNIMVHRTPTQEYLTFQHRFNFFTTSLGRHSTGTHLTTSIQLASMLLVMFNVLLL